MILNPPPIRLPTKPLRQQDVKLPYHPPYYASQFHHRKPLPHAIVWPRGERIKRTLIQHKLGFRGPSLGDELIRVHETPRIAVHGIGRHGDDGVTWNEAVVDGHTFWGSDALGAEEDGGAETHGFLYYSVEKGEGMLWVVGR